MKSSLLTLTQSRLVPATTFLLFVVSLVLPSAAVAVSLPSTTYDYEGYRYFVSTDQYDRTSDYPTAIRNVYGDDFEVVDWTFLKSEFTGRIESFLDGVGLASMSSASVSRDGDTTFNASRGYFITRNEGNTPDNYLVHDNIDSHYADLGSWYGNGNVLLRQLLASIQEEQAQEEKAEQESRTATAKMSSRLTSDVVSKRIMNVFSPKPSTRVQQPTLSANEPFRMPYADNSGLSSGSDPYNGLGIWAMGAYAKNNIYKSGFKSDNNAGLFLLGADYLVMEDRLALGVGAGYEESLSSVKLSDRRDNGQGFSVSPYAACRVTDDFMVKAVFNAAWNHYNANNGNPNYQGQRMMGDLSGEYFWLINAWALSAEVGYMYMGEDFNKSNTDAYLSEVRAGGKAGYDFGNGLVPYARVTVYQELGSSTAAGFDKQSYEGAAGLDYNTGPWILSAEAFDNVNSDHNTYGVSALVRYEF